MAKKASERGAAGGVLVAGRSAKAALRARGEELLAKAVALKERIARDFWELGRLLTTMRDEDVHAALGYERLDDMLDDRLGLARTAAWKLMAIAEQLPRDEAVKLGQEKAYAVVVYAKSTGAPEDAATLAKTDAPIGGKPLSQATVRELVAAAAAARPKKPSSLVERVRASADRALLKDVRARLADVGVPKDAVTLVGDHVVITLNRRQAERVRSR
ncbi:MAG: hypothetical protein U1F43_16085 [Myxococcota bacterium]